MTPEQIADVAAATKAQIDEARTWVCVSITKDGTPQIATCVQEDGDPIDPLAIAGMLDGVAFSCRKNTAGALEGTIRPNKPPG